MKSTDIERIDRELRQARKKEELVQKRLDQRSGLSVGDYIKKLYSLFAHDSRKIYNLKDNIKILELLEDMRKDLPEKQWENVLRKAIKETKIDLQERERAVKELEAMLSTHQV
jgi:hypothetical protein